MTERVFGQKSCDQCRSRKVRCIPVSGSRPIHGGPHPDRTVVTCTHCSRRHEECTFQYHWRKPGRPSQMSSGPPAKRARDGASQPVSLSVPSDVDRVHEERTADQSGVCGMSNTEPINDTVDPLELLPGPSAASLFGSARQAVTSPTPFRFDFALPPSCKRHNESLFDTLASGHPVNAVAPMTSQADNLWSSAGSPVALAAVDLPETAADVGFAPSGSGTHSTNTIGLSQSPSAAWFSPSYLLPLANTSPEGKDATHASAVFPDITHFTSWDNVCFFVSLHLRRQHVLVPLVHQPTFAADMLHRRDEGDEAFRGLLLSIVSYTICQTPVHLLGTRLSRQSLESLLRACQRGSRLVQIRHQMRPSITVLQSTILDWITSQATTAAELPDNLMSDVRRLVFALKVHTASPVDQRTRVEVELCRRLYWEAIAIDQTAAMYGHPVAIPYFEGMPPLPAEVDDEYILEDDMLPQPKTKYSYMTGFVFVTRLFRLFLGVTWRKHLLDSGGLTPELDNPALESYLRGVRTELATIAGDLPTELRPVSVPQGASQTILGTQAANICITMFCLELYILDIEINLRPTAEIARKKEEVAGRACREIQLIPVDYLASNGESLRGKVLWIIMTLLKASSEPDQLNTNVWDWWNMYSQIQFVQVIPTELASAVPTRPPSPSHR